jgi:hypothetical protein
MTSSAPASVSIQTSSHSSPAPPPWFGEVALLVSQLRKQGVLDAISAQVRFARRRFGRFEVIDFVAVLLGYALSGEWTLQAFYERLRPWASAFMALFGRDRLPLHPQVVAFAPIHWRDWSRRRQRRACLRLWRDQRVEIHMEAGRILRPPAEPPPLSRAERAHWRLSWVERLARNVRARAADPITIRLFGVPAAFATSLGLSTV